MRSFYRFIRGKAAGALGAGANGYGLDLTQSRPIYDGFNVPGYRVRGSLAPIEGAYNLGVQSVPFADVRGNGIPTDGALQIQRLAQMQRNG